MLLAISCWTFVRVFVGASATVALENIALRHQLVVVSVRALGLSAGRGLAKDRHETDVVGSVAFPVLPRWQIEVAIPLVFTDPRDTEPAGGVGDITLENKFLLYNSAERRALVSGGFETRFPSGSAGRGTGGEASIEPFLVAGKALGHLGLLAETAYKFDIDSSVKGPQAEELTAQAALGYHLGRFTPLLEVTTVTRTRGGDEARGGQPRTPHKTQVYLTPGFNVTSFPGSTFAVGLELPVTDARTFDYALRVRFIKEF